MFNPKVCLVLAAFFLFSLASGSAAECEDCLGNAMVQLVDTLVEKEQCWFNNKHHYLITFKVRMMSTINELLLQLHEATNELVGEKCKRQIQLRTCESLSGDSDGQAECYVDNSKNLVYNYRDQESCHQQILLPAQSTLIYKLLSGVIAGWHEIHTTC